MLLQRTHESCAIYDELLLLHPTQSHVLSNVGICRWKEGRLKAARNYFVLAANGAGLSRGDMSPIANIELVESTHSDPRPCDVVVVHSIDFLTS
jgi:hypothetical protein